MAQLLVDPALCRLWTLHNRSQSNLTQAGCADLIDSIRIQGRQEVAAIVRSTGDLVQPYEIICGARRHFAVTALRARGHDIGYLVDVRELTDSQAFVLADLENRNRRDLSPIERATDYARALLHLYDGKQRAMAGELGVTTSWLSRFLKLASLPPEILAAFPDPDEIRTDHATRLCSLLASPAHRDLMTAAADVIAREQAVRVASGTAPIQAAAVVKRLVGATAPEKLPAPRHTEYAHAPEGALLAEATGQAGMPLVVTIATLDPASRTATLAAIDDLMTCFATGVFVSISEPIARLQRPSAVSRRSTRAAKPEPEERAMATLSDAELDAEYPI